MADDDRLVDQLREVIEATDPPPRRLVDAAKASLVWRTVDAELAELVADSSTEPAAAVRSATEAPRLLTFTAGDTVVVLEVTREAGAHRVMGQIVAPAPATVEVRHAEGVVTVATDADGRFRAAPVAPGPISVSCRFDDDARPPLVTSWVSI
ncbi:carboxypeptidase regulatory-like domain-containing protein [Jiangella rhizosphaerae]|uniref:Carboxypeptidase regulatory-like domain-containing protein n=1 Tax=Jiangella rhizosphaerae TaxID=2293569 RepID=A0A418KUC6_9ACTN|nr:carboxypeptidase regulatory-like domain-containing protein [Jiangella rhizosphaerae]RIQ32129.1 carboxypeptidase regulatory-like domain-containing protein [Jiangella rhizosphaerae]